MEASVLFLQPSLDKLSLATIVGLTLWIPLFLAWIALHLYMHTDRGGILSPYNPDL